MNKKRKTVACVVLCCVCSCCVQCIIVIITIVICTIVIVIVVVLLGGGRLDAREGAVAAEVKVAALRAVEHLRHAAPALAAAVAVPPPVVLGVRLVALGKDHAVLVPIHCTPHIVREQAAKGNESSSRPKKPLKHEGHTRYGGLRHTVHTCAHASGARHSLQRGAVAAVGLRWHARRNGCGCAGWRASRKQKHAEHRS